MPHGQTVAHRRIFDSWPSKPPHVLRRTDIAPTLGNLCDRDRRTIGRVRSQDARTIIVVVRET